MTWLIICVNIFLRPGVFQIFLFRIAPFRPSNVILSIGFGSLFFLSLSLSSIGSSSYSSIRSIRHDVSFFISSFSFLFLWF